MDSDVPCIICGYWNEAEIDHGWQLQFRILYSFEGIARISRVGLYTPFEWRAPVDQRFHWDDENYHSQASGWVTLRQLHPLKDTHDFMLHDACWHLLQKAFDPQPVPLERLLDICKSLPTPIIEDGMYRDYIFGGIMLVNAQSHYPWPPLVRSLTDISIPRANPYNIPYMTQLLARPREESESRVVRLSQGGQERRDKQGEQDCFSRLPWEICEAIAIALPTCDALKLRQVSRSFEDITISQTFWASRFARGGERDFIFEMREGKRFTDWKLLYQNSRESRAPLGLRNRMRIWNSISSIKELLGLRLNGVTSPTRWLPQDPGRQWSRVTCEGCTQSLGAEPAPHYGCWVLHSAHVDIPQSLTHIAFSIIRVGTADYVAGLRLISADRNQHIGYQAEGKELFFAVTASAFRGFTVALGRLGIHALQVVCQDSTQSPWFGDPANALITNHLCRTSQVVGLEAELDGYKLVSIMVAEDSKSIDPLSLYKPELRDHLLWYPAVPPRDLLFNEESFMGNLPLPWFPPFYESVPWILFGGLQGELFPHLTKVSFSRGTRGNLHSIRFHYDELPDMKIQIEPLPVMEDQNFQYFFIDGKDGETITALTVSDSGCSGGSAEVRVIGIVTNRDRWFLFEPSPEHISLRRMTHLRIAPGSTLVGFFVSQGIHFGALGVGAISAVIRG